MMHPMSPSGKRCRASRKKWWAISLLVGVIYFPAIQVLYLRYFPPPVTGPQLVDWFRKDDSGQRIQRTPGEWIPLAAFPDSFVPGVILAEDAQFYRHHGFDWNGIRRSLAQARKSGQPPRGASTITQQCARSLFLWQGRSWVRKGIEAYYTIWMELLLPKRRILELYGNVIEFGNGVYGIEAAAGHFFDCRAKDLTVEQTSRLIAVMPQPRRLDPRQLSGKYQARQQWIYMYLKSKEGHGPFDPVVPGMSEDLTHD